ncbi:hypothetical protein [Acetobacter oeni]|uniref:Uncharacterized protein n=1 Tax=Acetobacter oeni TaxID=304077 RepID=A0A511XL26_9PROT|nr:hypothetical protein [Acetobacter oeni]MBB3883966.1 hypothetical protein [Acetobacter oeni]NHO19969.1 hypothetical protein [Acetobacter oeni]GBR05728.1 hypothetical protein AA21952_1809 [Acetobacter oeni LMG 21952]GEN63651.1 hypothetical protein AOE01nite_18750 [Acetobacter oeni]
MLTDNSGYTTNVVPFRQGVLPRHREYLARWLNAGLCMGLCDADIFIDDDAGYCGAEQILVWVRESADPAYIIRPAGSRWMVVDAIRGHLLSKQDSFELALNFIRPVLPLRGNVAAA